MAEEQVGNSAGTNNNHHHHHYLSGGDESDDNNATEIGITVVSETLQITMDNFWFLVDKDAAVAPFDFVSVINNNRTVTVGIVNELHVIPQKNPNAHHDPKGLGPPSSSSSSPSSVCSASITTTAGDECETPAQQHQITEPSRSLGSSMPDDDNNNTTGFLQSYHHLQLSEKGVMVAKVTVFANIERKGEEKSAADDQEKEEIIAEEQNQSVLATDMPVMPGRSVRFAALSEVISALGVPRMEKPIPAGIIEMSNGTKIPISLDISYLAGPDTAHVNAAGISGNLKTTYLLFLLYSVYQKLTTTNTNNNNDDDAVAKRNSSTTTELRNNNNNVALIIFNTRDDDLLHIEEEGELQEHDNTLYKIMNLNAKPFSNVTYFLPRGTDGRPNSVFVPKNSRTYSFELEDIFDRLELLFAETLDPYYDSIYSLVSYIAEAWPLIDSSRKEKKRKTVKTWSDLAAFAEYPSEIVAHRSSFLHFLAYLQKFRKSPLFVDKRKTSIYLGKAIKQITAGDVYVIDLARIPTLEEQTLVVGDVMRSIDDMHSYASSFGNDGSGGESSSNAAKSDGGYYYYPRRPEYLFIFIDEINRFLPKSKPERRIPATADQITRTVIAGKSRNTILFSAQQFKSAVDMSLIENTGTHTIAKLGLSELSAPPYSMIDDTTKRNIVRLRKGEIVLVHPAFRQPIKITFPKVAFKRPY